MQPAIMVMGCASPDGAGVIEVSDLVDIISPHAASYTVSSGEQLCILDDHLGAVLVTVVLGTFLWITIKEKDVHGYIVAGGLLMSSVYSRLTGLLTESPIIDDDGDAVDVDYSPEAWKQAGKAHTSSPKLLRRMKKWSKGAKKLADGPVDVPVSSVLRTGRRVVRQETGKGGKTAPSLIPLRPNQTPTQSTFVVTKRKPK